MEIADFPRLKMLLALNELGDVVRLSPFLDAQAVLEDLLRFRDDWRPYNPHKTGYERWGLSLTSLDGRLSGEPDLYSLKEYNEAHGTNFCEDDFRIFTPVHAATRGLAQVLETFDSVGRSHFLKFGCGGLFPPHRDNATLDPDCFRLLVSLADKPDDYSFVVDGREYALEPGAFYLVNTTLTHSLFSFHAFCHFLVLNVPLTFRHVEMTRKLRFSR